MEHCQSTYTENMPSTGGSFPHDPKTHYSFFFSTELSASGPPNQELCGLKAEGFTLKTEKGKRGTHLVENVPR